MAEKKVESTVVTEQYESDSPLHSHASHSDDNEEFETRHESIEEQRHGFHEIGLAEPLAPLTPVASRIEHPGLSRTATGVSTMSLDPTWEITFDDDDKEDPRNWPKWYKGWIIFSCAISTTTVVLYSSAYTSGIPGMMAELHVADEYVVLLGLTTYLLGLAVGSVICAPLSEMFGRRPIYIGSLALYTLLVLPCALAHDIGTILGVRFLAAIIGVSTIANAPGSINDIVTEEYRALAFSIWSIDKFARPSWRQYADLLITSYERASHWAIGGRIRVSISGLAVDLLAHIDPLGRLVDLPLHHQGDVRARHSASPGEEDAQGDQQLQVVDALRREARITAPIGDFVVASIPYDIHRAHPVVLGRLCFHRLRHSLCVVAS